MFSAFTIENRARKNLFLLLLALLLLKAAFSLFLIATYGVDLAPDEAQYWTWSQRLDWGYYSKPPAVAWQIFLTTKLFGNTAFGVRFGAVLIAFFLPLVTFATARAARFSEQTAFWAAIVMAFSPIGIFLSFMATTDGGMLIFLALAICSIVRGLEEEEGPHYAITGLWVLLGALYKWSAYIVWPITLLLFPFLPKLRKKEIFFGIALSLCALLPSLYWNVTHDFATFKHVGETVTKKIGKHGNFFDFLFAQIALFSPIYWGLLLLSLRYLRKQTALLYCIAYPSLFLLFFLAALFKRMQPNWALFLYPAAALPVAWVAIERLRTGRVWLHVGTWLALLSSLFALSIPYLQRHTHLPIPYKASPFRQNMGWHHLTALLRESGYDPEKDFLFGDKYQTASLLSFYGPDQKQAYFFNLNRDRKNQFSYWPQVEKGKRGYFVVLENVKEEAVSWYRTHYLERLSPYFDNIRFVKAAPLFRVDGVAVKHALIFRCDRFCGVLPPDPEKY